MTSEHRSCLELPVSGASAAEGLEPSKGSRGRLCPPAGHRQGWLSQSCAIPEFIKQRPDKAELSSTGGGGAQLLDLEPGVVCSLPTADGQLHDS